MVTRRSAVCSGEGRSMLGCDASIREHYGEADESYNLTYLPHVNSYNGLESTT